MDALWFYEPVVIKKVVLYFTIMFWYLIVHYQLCSTVTDNLLYWDDATLIASIAIGFDIDFMAIIRYEMHEKVFGETSTLPFPCLVQLLYDKIV